MTATARGEAAGSLLGLEVAITGRLASMSRADAVEHVHRAGGRYAPRPGERTALLVFGQGGPPLEGDGRLTRSLREARALQERGAPLRIVPEEELLALLDPAARGEGLQRLYTTEQLARVLSVARGEVRAWIRRGLVRPVRTVGRLCFFDFREVSAARTLLALLREGVAPGRIARSLEQLAAWGEAAAPSLAQLEALERSDLVCVRLADGRLAEPSGQLLLFDGEPDQDAGADADLRAPVALATLAPTPTAERWFQRGVAAEEAGRFEVAAAAYQDALRAGGERPEVLFNLGNTLYALDRREAAVDCFERATAADPDYVEAWNNLGNVQAELERDSEAVTAYRRALAIAPGYADAHFNLAEALARTGDRAGARRHWREYLALDPRSPWAGEVRARLAELEDAGG